MGRGNVSVSGLYEGLFYISNDDYFVYRLNDPFEEGYPETKLGRDLGFDETTSGDWIYDDIGSAEELEYIEEEIVDRFCDRFPSFQSLVGMPGKWIVGADGQRRGRRILAESGLFYLCDEDNQNSVAIELIQKECWYDDHLSGLQKQHYLHYLDTLKEIMLDMLPSVGGYSGPWTQRTITRGE